MNETAYPLFWPLGWKRTAPLQRRRARFASKSNGRPQELSVAQASDRLRLELERLGARAVVISTNLELRLDGLPRSSQRTPEDPGVAVYFEWRKRKTVFACDRWDRVADNLAAIAAHIYAIRAVARYGVGDLEQAFRGYQALPAPGFKHDWREVLGDLKTLDDVERVYRERARRLHPDVGGSPVQMAELNLAVRDARAEFAQTA